jgi:hypothetical protein
MQDLLSAMVATEMMTGSGVSLPRAFLERVNLAEGTAAAAAVQQEQQAQPPSSQQHLWAIYIYCGLWPASTP